MSEINVQDIFSASKILVVKVGSVLVRGSDLDKVNQEWINSFASDVNELMKRGTKVVVVSSGGVALGRKALGIAHDTPPQKIPLAKKQAASSVGQYYVFNGYNKAFSKLGIDTAQVLLTMTETENRRMNLNARETLFTLLDAGIVPVINENDTVSTEEIRFGDNDRLGVRVAQMVGADCVVLMSTTDGLYTSNPDINPGADHISVVGKLGVEHTTMAGDAIPGLSTGGMKSKIKAASSATKSGIHLIITEGRKNNSLIDLADNPDKRSSLFIAEQCKNTARKIWIATHMSPKGSITVDDGAMKALNTGKSLLPIGARFVEGEFKRGDVVELLNSSGDRIGMGIVAYNSHDAQLICGRNSSDIEKILGYVGRDELVHRNDMVMDS